MRGKLRTGGAAVGFFAFQDIITAVIGVVIFIALLLSLFIGNEADAIRQKRLSESATPEQLHELNALLKQIQSLQDQLTTVLSRPSQSATYQQEEQLKSWLSTITAQLENLRAITPDSGEPTQIEIDGKQLAQIISSQEERLHDILDETTKIRSTNLILQQQVDDLQKAILEEEKNRHDIWLIADKSITTKQPLLVLTSSTGFELKTLIGASTKSSSDLEELLKGFQPTEYYIVFYLKPSAFAKWDQIFDAAKNLQFDVGYEPIQEDQQIMIGSPKS